MSESYAEAFPLIRSGGVFLCIVGAAMALGAAHMRRRFAFLGVGAAIASAVLAISAIPLTAPFGAPTMLQLASLAAAVALEVAAIAWAGRALAQESERTRTLAVLTIVGAHFLLMAPAFGPIVVVLGGAAWSNALLGHALPRAPLTALWLSDGALKLLAGAAMFYAHRIPCWLCW